MLMPHVWDVVNPAGVHVGSTLVLPAAVSTARGYGVGATVRVRGQVVVRIVPKETHG